MADKLTLKFAMIPPQLIRPMSQGQPRRWFDEVGLAELQRSIRRHGQQQPVRVFELTADETRRDPQRRQFELIFGERRWRACSRIGKSLFSIIVPRPSENVTYAEAAIENECRENLSPYERAATYTELQTRLGYSEKELAATLGLHFVTVHSYLRLGRLHPDALNLMHPKLPKHQQLRTQVALELQKYSESDQKRIAPMVIGLTLKKAEPIIKKEATSSVRARSRSRKPADMFRLLNSLQSRMRTDVGRFLELPKEYVNERVARIPADRIRLLAADLDKIIEEVDRLRRQILTARGIGVDETENEHVQAAV